MRAVLGPWLGGERNRSLQLSRSSTAYPFGLYCGALGLFTLMATASLFVAGPQIEVDEGSYLVTAATLAGKLNTSGVQGYYSGYSFLLLPAFFFGASVDRFYHSALLINALLVATTPFALFRLTRALFPEVPARWHAATAIAATCYASLLLTSQHAMSESALVPLYAWLLATGAEAVLSARRFSALVCGFLAGMLFLVHPRGGLMAAGVLVGLSLFCLPRQNLRAAITMTWIAAFCIGALHAPLESLAGKITALGNAYDPDGVLKRLSHFSNWRWVGLNAFGALTEAVVSSIGVVAIALAWLAAELVADAKAGRHSPQTGVLVGIALGTIVALLMSAIFFIPPQRADHIAYGRYALPATVPLIVLGLMRLKLATRARWPALLALGAGFVAIAVLNAAFSRLPSTTTSVWNYVNLPILYIAQSTGTGMSGAPDAWSHIAICFAACCGVLYAAAGASRMAGVAAYTSLNLAIAAYGWMHVTLPGANAVMANRDVVAAASAFETVTGTPLCADLARGLRADFWLAVDMRWHLLNALSDTRRGEAERCAHAWVEALEIPAAQGNAAPIAIERRRPLKQESIGLFVESGTALDAWRAKMAAVPSELLVPLRDDERRAEVEILSMSKPPNRLHVGDMLSVEAHVTNDGSDSTWPASDAGPYPILLGARTFRGDEVNAAGEYRKTFAEPLAARQSTTLRIDVGPFTQPGTYRLSIGVVQERVAWFAGARELTVRVSDE